MNDQNSILYTDSSNTYNSGVGFAIAYIDEDDIPELIIRYTDKLHVGGAVLCAYSKGNVMTLQKSMGQWGYFNYVERQGIVSVPYTGTETETTVTYYRLEGLAFKEECTMSKMNPNSNKVTFYVDGNEVTKEKYQEKENEYIQGYQPWKGVELNGLNVENIGRILGADTTGFNDPKQQDYILPDSSQKYLIDADVSALSAEQLRIARNEIYARHGYIFRSEDLQTYFSGKEWYSPSVLADNFSDEMLSALELANLDLIKKYEEMRKSETN